MKMKRLVPYLGIVAALAVVLFVAALSFAPTAMRSPATSTTTAPAVTQVTSPPASGVSTSSIAATTTPPVPRAQKTTAPKASVTTTIQPVSVPVAQPVPTNAELDASASLLRAALVNIICYAPAGTRLHSISGSGVFIDAKGIILTNAHIAQYFLLADRNVSCTIRAGSPAADSYEASLIYISPAWLNANASAFVQTLPSGTGEYDFALLAVTKSATRNALPASFPFVPLAVTPPNIGTPVVIASYGAQFLDSGQIQSGLFPTIVFGSVKDVFTFMATTIDVLALGGSAAAQEGSSGGGIADSFGKLVATITTSTVTGDTSTRSLDAITASYIRSDYASETGNALDLLLAEPTATAIADFAPNIPALESILTVHLQ